VRIDPTPQEVSWTAPLDEDTEHATYDPAKAAAYLDGREPRRSSYSPSTARPIEAAPPGARVVGRSTWR
jgi:hypothetical protein